MTHFRLQIDLGQPMNTIVFGALPAGLLGLYLFNTMGKPHPPSQPVEKESLAILPASLALGIVSSTFYFVGSILEFVGMTIWHSSQHVFFIL